MREKPLVLLIDDSLVNLALLKKTLQKHDFNIVLANNGEQGLIRAKQNMPDLILLDVLMPGWDGYETCFRIKQRADLASIPILFLSALNDSESKVRALQVGAVDYVSKPFQEDELLARVRTHVELSHLRKNLEREVTHQTEKIRSLLVALQASFEKAKEASLLKTQFLRNISHEFRTPMNIILGMADILLEDTPVSEEQHHCVESIKSAGTQLFEILNNMLLFAQQFSHELPQEACDFMVTELIDDVLATMLKRAQDKQLLLLAEVPPNLAMPLRANYQYLREILNKLVDNAIKFTAEGKVVIRARLTEYGNQKQLYFEVADTGIGIPIEHQIHVFEIFSQADNSTTRSFDGMGMGLAVAKLFTETLGGKIGMQSTVNKGSKFWFQVPVYCLGN